MTNKKDENSELLTKLISTVQKKNDKEKVNDSVKSEIQRMIDSYHNNCIEETLWK